MMKKRKTTDLAAPRPEAFRAGGAVSKKPKGFDPMPTKRTPDHLDALQRQAADARRAGGSLATALDDLRRNGFYAAPASIRAVLTLAEPPVGADSDLPPRLQRAVTALDSAVECANLAQPHVFGLRALSLAPRTLARITEHMLDDAERHALLRGMGDVWPSLRTMHQALGQHAVVLEAVAPRTRDSLALADQTFRAAVSQGPAGTCVSSEPALTQWDIEYHTVTDPNLRLALVLLGDEIPMTPGRLLEWYMTHRPGVFGYALKLAEALQVLGETLDTRHEQVRFLLHLTLIHSGARRFSVATRMSHSAVSELAVHLVQMSRPSQKVGRL